MLLRKILLISLILISCANADTIYNIIKIPHLEIYKSKTSNKINYLQSTKPFQVGIMKNNITCFQTKIDLYKEKFKIIERISINLKESKKKIVDIDGLRVTSDDGWWLLRASNTQPVLVLRCESLSEEGLKKQINFVKQELKKINFSFSNEILS